MTLISSWLKNKLVDRKSGIIFDCQNGNSFDFIQDFIESCDLCFQTPIIYYQAFPEESAIEFLNTLRAELASKLAKLRLIPQQSLLEVIEDAELKMIVIDRCHLHPQDTLENLLDFFASCNVAVILVGDRRKMAISQILNNPRVFDWNRFEIAESYESSSKLR